MPGIRSESGAGWPIIDRRLDDPAADIDVPGPVINLLSRHVSPHRKVQQFTAAGFAEIAQRIDFLNEVRQVDD